VGINLNAAHLKRYRDIAGLLWKYGRSDLVRRSGLDQALGPEIRGDRPPAEAAGLAADLEAMGPTFVNRILETVASNNLKIKVDAIDETGFLQGLQKIANRITLGLVLAALIIGGAVLMRVETSFRILGYPGAAVLLFIAAAGGGIALVVAIVLGDVKSRKKR
jgi:hypothetical protein